MDIDSADLMESVPSTSHLDPSQNSNFALFQCTQLGVQSPFFVNSNGQSKRYRSLKAEPNEVEVTHGVKRMRISQYMGTACNFFPLSRDNASCQHGYGGNISCDTSISQEVDSIGSEMNIPHEPPNYIRGIKVIPGADPNIDYAASNAYLRELHNLRRTNRN